MNIKDAEHLKKCLEDHFRTQFVVKPPIKADDGESGVGCFRMNEVTAATVSAYMEGYKKGLEHAMVQSGSLYHRVKDLQQITDMRETLRAIRNGSDEETLMTMADDCLDRWKGNDDDATM